MSECAGKLIELSDRARRENRLTDAQRDLVRAVALCREAGEQQTLVQALKKLGQIERDLGNGEAAQPLYEEAVSICRTGGDPLVLAHTIRHLGDVHQDAGRLETAEAHYHEALSLYRDHQERVSALELANAIRPLAMLKDKMGDSEGAVKLWEEALGFYEKAGVAAGVAECSARLGRGSG